MRDAAPRDKIHITRAFSIAILLAVIIFTIWQIPAPTPWGFSPQGWLALGAVLGMAPFLGRRPGVRRLALLAAAVGYTAAISLGSPSPALASSALVMALWSVLAERLDELCPTLPGWQDCCRRDLCGWALLALAGFAGIRLHTARTRMVYMDQAAPHLTAEVGRVLSGGAGVFTNPTTHAFLADLERTAREVRTLRGPQRAVAIIPDCPAWWIRSNRPNPLPLDWLYPVEYASPALKQRVLDSLAAQRGDLTILTQRHDARHLGHQLRPVPAGERAGYDKVRRDWKLAGRTDYLEIFE